MVIREGFLGFAGSSRGHAVIELRPAAAGDYDAYARLRDELGVPDPLPSRDKFVAQIAPRVRIACKDGAVVGFGSWRAYGKLAHFVQLAVDPAVRGQRIGEQLMREIRELALSAGCTRWYLNVKRDNASAIKLYERLGFRTELQSVALAIAWRRVPALDVDGGLADPADDPAIAARFDVPLERIAQFRERAGVLHHVILRDGPARELAGYASFDPDHPGAAVFRTIRAELGAALLAAMRPFALPAFDFVRVTVDGDPGLAAALIELGADVTFELLRMSAPLT